MNDAGWVVPKREQTASLRLLFLLHKLIDFGKFRAFNIAIIAS